MTESSPINRAHNKENKRYHSMMYYYVHLYYNIGLTKRQQDKEHLQMWYIYDDDDDDGGWIFHDESDRSPTIHQNDRW